MTISVIVKFMFCFLRYTPLVNMGLIARILQLNLGFVLKAQTEIEGFT